MRSIARGPRPEEIDRVVYPFLSYDEETRLFERNLAKERQFLTETEAGATNAEIEKARARIPAKREPVPGLADPNEKQEKGLLKNLAYRVLASEGVVSRNVAKRGVRTLGQGRRQVSLPVAAAARSRAGLKSAWATNSSASSTT
jgi:carbamoyltransferase